MRALPRPLMPARPRRSLRAARVALAVAVACATVLAGPLARAQGAPAPTAPAPRPAAEPVPPNSALNAPLFYQLLIGEMQIQAGDPRAAYELVLDAARRSPDESLYRRAMEIALQSRAGDQALAAIRAWRGAFPKSVEATRNHAQILVALNRPAEAVEPLRALIGLTPPAQQPALVSLVPRFFAGQKDGRAAAGWIEQTVQPWLDTPATRVAARVAMARGWLAARDPARALQLAQQAQALDVRADGPALVAVELMAERKPAEELVTRHLAAQPRSLAVQLGYARALAAAQRYVEAIAQLDAVTRDQPALAAPWLTLGALHVELRHPAEATAALQRYLAAAEAVAGTSGGAVTVPVGPDAVQVRIGDGDDDEDGANASDGRTTAYLLLAQAAEQEQRFADAERWLARIDNPGRALEVLSRRASLMARQGQVDQARELLRRAPERTPEDRRAKLLAEAQVLRDVRQWGPALEVLQTASRAFPDDTDLLYEQSMMAEKLDRLDEMERLLRRVIELRPDHHHAYNALGYTFADRNIRLQEARTLILRALELAPGEPFITDSLGWVEFRLGNRDEALRLLRKAYAARPDPEIGAHLGEVLWSAGLKDEARRVWTEARRRDAANEVLRETLQRLKVEP